MSTLSTHVLDTSNGRPAAGLKITLERSGDKGWIGLGSDTTNDDGRVAQIHTDSLDPGSYRLTFATGEWFRRQGVSAYFYETVPVEFTIREREQHFHVPLLLSAFGYSTYRGS